MVVLPTCTLMHHTSRFFRSNHSFNCISNALIQKLKNHEFEVHIVNVSTTKKKEIAVAQVLLERLENTCCMLDSNAE